MGQPGPTRSCWRAQKAEEDLGGLGSESTSPNRHLWNINPTTSLPPIVISSALLSLFCKCGQSHHGSQGEGGGYPTAELFPFFLLFLKPGKKKRVSTKGVPGACSQEAGIKQGAEKKSAAETLQ